MDSGRTDIEHPRTHTTKFCEDFETKESEKKIGSELTLHFKKKEVDKANSALKTTQFTASLKKK